MKRNQLARLLLSGALILCAALAWADDRNLQPKYGSLPKADWQKVADEKFISGMDEDYHGDRKKASDDMSARGWQYLRAGDHSDAMRRFNQSWLLNNDNGTALWGMAAIEADARKFDESLKLFAEAEKFVGGEVNFSVDYANAVAIAGIKRRNKGLLDDAFSRFGRIYQIAPQNARNLKNWATTLFSLKRYTEAWVKVIFAEALPNGGGLDPRFLAALQSRMPRPRD
jgi:tetratricopeptide (TPR) repeat protein